MRRSSAAAPLGLRCGLALLALLCVSLCVLSVSSARTFPFDPSAPPPNPNPPSREEVLARNARRFPGEWFPEGYDVGEPALTGTAWSETMWMSPAGKAAAREPRVWYDESKPRPPGRLLLNMLVRNEAENLARTLPKWKHVIDYWIIGVDEKNDDDSVAIIKRELGHLPGEIATVHGFDGHGPTWTTLVDLGVAHYPGATHGIIADADFAPMQSRLDRAELDIRCSKHMYTIWTEDHRNERKMDWIYRNIPGAKIKRRTHQVVEVPIFPEQEVYQTLINLPLDERAGGYGDRSGNKQERYIAWMAADLKDFPDDPRALYYLGYGYLDLYNVKHDQHALQQAIHYFDRRVELPPAVGNKEERWFAMLKLAEIHERYLRDWNKAEAYYRRCIALDDVRADPHFYIGQHYRLTGQPALAEPHLHTAATLKAPVRSLFMWYYLYDCLGELEYGRNHLLRTTPSLKQSKKTRAVLQAADCSQGDPGDKEELDRMIATVQQQIDTARAKKKARKQEMEQKAAVAAAAASAAADADVEENEVAAEPEQETTDPREAAAAVLAADDKTPLVRRLLAAALPLADALEAQALSVLGSDEEDEDDGASAAAGASSDADALANVHEDLVSAAKRLGDYLAVFEQRKKSRSAATAAAKFLSCRRFRRATTPLLRITEQERQRFDSVLSGKEKQQWQQVVEEARRMCR